MRKYFISILLIGVLLLMPIKTYALVDTGNATTAETKDSETTNDVTTGPNEGDNQVTSQGGTTSNDDVLYQENEASPEDEQTDSKDELLYTTQKSNKLITTKDSNKNNILYITVSGVSGIFIGGVIIYFIQKKRAQ